jgi:hypothetical protein
MENPPDPQAKDESGPSGCALLAILAVVFPCFLILLITIMGGCAFGLFVLLLKFTIFLLEKL